MKTMKWMTEGQEIKMVHRTRLYHQSARVIKVGLDLVKVQFTGVGPVQEECEFFSEGNINTSGTWKLC